MSYIGNMKIGKMYLGNIEIAKAYLGNSLVYQNGGSPEPTNISYIRGGGDGSYIDTGITPDNTTRVVVWARNFNPPGNSIFTWLFGSRVADSNSAFAINAMYTANVGKIRVPYANINNDYPDKWALFGGYHKYELGPNGFYCDDVLIGAMPSSTFSNIYNIYLFGVNNAGTNAHSDVLMDICACKIYKSGALVRDLTAVNTPSVGFYDAVSDTVFTNAGTGSFTYGTFIKDTYTPLEYIEDNAASYFDSGVKGTYTMAIVTMFRPTGSTPRWHTLLGYRTSTNSCDISFGTATSGQDNVRVYWRFGPNDTNTTVSSSTKLTGHDTVVVKTYNSTALTVYKAYSKIGTGSKSGVSSSFVTDGNLYVGALLTSSGASALFEGRLYYARFGNERNFVPAMVSGVAGMYDTYNDVFYPSISGTAFTAGPVL